MAKTSEEYVKASSKCPSCDSDNISGDEVTVEEGSASQRVTCSDCSSSWYDIYELVGYEFLEEAEVVSGTDN